MVTRVCTNLDFAPSSREGLGPMPFSWFPSLSKSRILQAWLLQSIVVLRSAAILQNAFDCATIVMKIEKTVVNLISVDIVGGMMDILEFQQPPFAPLSWHGDERRCPFLSLTEILLHIFRASPFSQRICALRRQVYPSAATKH